jgi:hypothetical protein
VDAEYDGQGTDLLAQGLHAAKQIAIDRLEKAKQLGIRGRGSRCGSDLEGHGLLRVLAAIRLDLRDVEFPGHQRRLFGGGIGRGPMGVAEKALYSSELGAEGRRDGLAGLAERFAAAAFGELVLADTEERGLIAQALRAAQAHGARLRLGWAVWLRRLGAGRGLLRFRGRSGSGNGRGRASWHRPDSTNDADERERVQQLGLKAGPGRGELRRGGGKRR